MKTYLAIYFGTVLTAICLVPIISRIAKKFHLVDMPDPRKVHQIPVPRVGGIVFVISTLAFVVPCFFLNDDIGQSFREVKTQLIVLLASACFVFLVGLIDDLHPLPGLIKLLCLIIASLAICASSATLHSISIGNWFEIETGWVSWPLTVLWIVVITIGMNFIDGLDGLAAGIASFVCGAIFLLALWSGQTAMSILMLVLLGSVTGFLFFNFYPAKIFMGDCGSMFLGFMIGAGSLVCQAKTATFVGLAIPLLVLGVPVFDAALTMIRRAILYRRSVFSSEMGHIHHYLLDMGLPQLTAVIIIYALTAISASLGLFMLTTTGGWSIFLFTGGLIFILLVFIYLGAAHIRETIAAIKRNRNITRKIKLDKNYFENAQLYMRQAVSSHDWWESICILAKNMQFKNMDFSRSHDGNSEILFSWKPAEEVKQTDPKAEFILPVFQKDSDVKLQIKLGTPGSDFLEVTCRRVALLGRLIDEFPPPDGILTLKSKEQYEDIKQQAKECPELLITEKQPVKKAAGIPESIDVLGVPVTPFDSYSEALGCIEKIVETHQRSFWIAINPQKCFRAWHEPELKEILNRVDACICDGVGMSIASKILNGISIRRCTGCDLFFDTISLASGKKWKVFLLGASPESNSNAYLELTKKFPDLQIVGRQDGYFKDSSIIVERINASKANLLFVAMGSPKQEYWIWQNWESLKVNFCLGVGGSFDVASGDLKRAPKIFQKTGTEFLFQLITEPRKRWPRQKVYFPFMLRVIFKKIFGTAFLGQNNTKKTGETVLNPLISKSQKNI
jgi:exopolysaccharide biosynthesis WecB/TagA/CpsF family protein